MHFGMQKVFGVQGESFNRICGMDLQTITNVWLNINFLKDMGIDSQGIQAGNYLISASDSNF